MASTASSSQARPGAQQSALSANNGQFAPLTLQPNNPCHLYKGYSKCANYVPTEVTIEPSIDNTRDNGTTEFKVEAHGDKLGTVDLEFGVDITQAGEAALDTYLDTEDAGAATLCVTGMVGGAGYFAWDRIEILNGTNRVHTFYPEDLLLKDLVYSDEQKLRAINRLTGASYAAMGIDDAGFLTGTFEDEEGRDTSGIILLNDPVKSANRKYIIRLPTFWSGSLDRWLDIKSLGQALTVRVYWSDASKYGYTNHLPGATWTLRDAKLRARYTHIPKAERTAHDQRVNATRDGFTMKWVEWRNQPRAEFNASAGATVKYKIDSLRGVLSHGFLLIQKKESGYDGTPATAGLRGRGGVEGSALSVFYRDRQPFDLLDIDTYEVTSTGATLFPETDDFRAKNVLYKDHFPSVGSGLSAYPILFTYNALGDFKHVMGGIDIGNIHQPEVVIKRDGGLVQGAETNRYVSVRGVHHDWWTIAGGEVVKVFHS